MFSSSCVLDPKTEMTHFPGEGGNAASHERWL